MLPVNIRHGARALGFVALLAVAGCGSDSNDSSPSASEPTSPRTDATTTTTGSTTTTVVEAADEATTALAEAGVVTLEDLPEGWSEAAGAQEFATKGIATDDCQNPPDAELAALPLGAAAASPTFASPDNAFFLTTWTAVFPDEETATTWVTKTASEEYEECFRAALEATSSSTGSEFEVRTRTSDEERAGVGQNGLARVASYELVNDGEVTSTVYTTTFQVGRALQHLVIESGPVEADVFIEHWTVADQAGAVAGDRLTEAQAG